MRYFNTEGRCRPEEHYMVPLDDRLDKIKRLYVDRKKYFVINRGRQYGKTTTLMALEEYLKNDYMVLFMDFQMISSTDFADEQTFTVKFAEYIEKLFSKREQKDGIDLQALEELASLKEKQNISMDMLFARLSRNCETCEKPIVLMIDEVDSASYNQVFIDFLSQLRGYYLNRENNLIFHSVILAGVYDVKNLKLKLRDDREYQYNSPWNIAADFDIDMSFSARQIASMLREYEADYHMGMDVEAAGNHIYQYTSGYPYLVSAICKIMDEKLPDKEAFADRKAIWTAKGIDEAVKILMDRQIPLFGSMMRHISEYPDLKKLLYAMLFLGEQAAYNPDNETIELAHMFGYVKNSAMGVQVANRIFEMRLYNLFLSEEELSSAMSRAAKQDRNQFVAGGRLFLLYLKPIINGVGNYYIDAQTRDARRTDVIVDYGGEQFVIEMKLWHGNEYHQRGKRQLAECLDYYHQEKGYLLSFNFNKKKKTGVQEIPIDGKTIIEAVV